MSQKISERERNLYDDITLSTSFTNSQLSDWSNAIIISVINIYYFHIDVIVIFSFDIQ